MNIDIFKDNFENLENIWKTDENGVEFIYARDLAKVLGYGGKDYWRNFKNPLEKAIISCENNGEVVEDHFANVREMVEVGSRAKREIKDYKLTRYACYLIAQNGDPRKNEIAFAQNYFAVQTRNFEIVMQRKNDYDRVLERYELKEAERIFSEELYQRGVDSDGFARIRSKGDEVLFGGNTTKQMKEKLDIPAKHHNRPLADFLNPALVTAKKLAMQLSNINIVSKDIKGETNISDEHIENNKALENYFKREQG